MRYFNWQTSFVTYWHRYSRTMDECLLFRFYSSVFFRFRSALHSKQLLQWHIDQVLQTFCIFCIFYSIYDSINTRGSTCFKNRLENSFQVKILTSTRLNSKFFCTYDLYKFTSRIILHRFLFLTFKSLIPKTKK